MNWLVSNLNVRRFLDSWHAEVLSSGVAAYSGFAAEVKLVRLVSAGACALHTLLFGFNPGTQELGN